MGTGCSGTVWLNRGVISAIEQSSPAGLVAIVAMLA